jgi:hypothetical protein
MPALPLRGAEGHCCRAARQVGLPPCLGWSKVQAASAGRHGLPQWCRSLWAQLQPLPAARWLLPLTVAIGVDLGADRPVVWVATLGHALEPVVDPILGGNLGAATRGSMGAGTWVWGEGARHLRECKTGLPLQASAPSQVPAQLQRRAPRPRSPRARTHDVDRLAAVRRGVAQLLATHRRLHRGPVQVLVPEDHDAAAQLHRRARRRSCSRQAGKQQRGRRAQKTHFFGSKNQFMRCAAAGPAAYALVRGADQRFCTLTGRRSLCRSRLLRRVNSEMLEIRSQY